MLANDVCRCAGLVGLSICKDRDQCQRYIHRSSGRISFQGMRDAGKPCEFLILLDIDRESGNDRG
jgi:hypothetical protein